MEKRLRYLDVAKGFAILLMVFGHLEVICEPVKVWIYAFHMPLFFVVCGMLISNREENKPESLKWDGILRRRLYQLGVPYIVWSFMFVCYLWIMAWIGGEELDVAGKVKSIVTLRGASTVWFLPCYLIAEIMMVVACQYRKTLCTIPIIAFFILYYGGIDTPVITRSCMGFIMVTTGYLFSRYIFKKQIPVIWALLCIGAGSMISVYQGRCDLNSMQFNNISLYILTWILFCFGFMSIFIELDKYNRFEGLVRFLSFWGRNSIVLLCTHMFFVEMFRYFDYKLFNDIIRDSSLIGSIPLTALVCLMEIPIIKLSSIRFRWTFGK